MSARTLACITFVLAAGCGDNSAPPVRYVDLCFPPPFVQGQGCVYPSTCGNTLLGEVWVDPAAAQDFSLPLQYTNTIVADTAPGTIHFHDATIEQYTISYQGIAVPTATVRTNLSVPASTTVSDLVTIIPAETMAQIQALALSSRVHVVAHIDASGHYNGDSTFTTGPNPLSFDVCDGCAFSAANLCVGKTFVGGCPGGAVSFTVGGVPDKIVAWPVNAVCQ